MDNQIAMNKKIKICFIDEEATWRMEAYRNFKDEFEVHIVEDDQFPKEVSGMWQIITDADADVVIVDYRLNESGILSYTGESVLREIRKHNLYLPVFMVTSYEDNAIQECDEVQIIRGKNVLNTAENLSKFKHLISAAVERYQKKKAESEKIVQELSRKLDAGQTLTESEVAHKFDAELYLASLDLESGVRANMINQTTSQQMSDMLTLAQSIVERLDK